MELTKEEIQEIIKKAVSTGVESEANCALQQAAKRWIVTQERPDGPIISIEVFVKCRIGDKEYTLRSLMK